MGYNTDINSNVKNLKQPITIRVCKMRDLDHKKMQVKVVISSLEEQQGCFGNIYSRVKLGKELFF